MRGCLDYFIELQQREIGADGKPLLDEVMLRGLMVNFLTAGNIHQFWLRMNVVNK